VEGGPEPTSRDNEVREHAIARLKAKRDFKSLLGTAVVVTAILTVIWALSDGGYFWPIWVMFGFGVALLFGGWRAYGPSQGPITEEDIQREMEK
jgi:uncharacterized membrane protein